MTTSNVGAGQSTTSLTLHPGDSENVYSGGRSIDTTILDAGVETVYAGGIASFTTISRGGYQVISVGGFATGTTVGFGGIEGVSFGGTARGTTVQSSGTQAVGELGSSVDTIVLSSGTETIDGGAISISTTVSSGGFETVASGGVTSDTTVKGGYEIVYTGAVASDTIMSGGSAVILGSAVSTTIRGGYESLSGGSATDTTVSSGGYLDISRGLASDTTVSSGGYEYVFSGTANSTTVDRGGTDFISSGGAANFTTIASGGFEYIYLSGVARGTTIDSGGEQFILSGGLAGGAAVSGGRQYVYSGGDATFTTVVGGNEYVYSGAVAYATTISHGGVVEVAAATGVAIATTVRSAGDLYVAAGSANFTTISSGGYDHVSSGVTNGTTVLDGGSENIVAGGVAVSTTISSGGTEYIASGGVASDTILRSGGTIDVGYFAYASRGTAILTLSTDVLTVSQGGHTYTQQMSGSYTGEYFHLAPDIGGGTLITLNNTPCYCCGTHILTDRGEVEVEDLRIGDCVVTQSGAARPIRWIGQRHLDLRRHPAPEQVQPIRFRADALADGAPHRDLLVSPDHAVLLDGGLIPARLLVNGASIAREARCEAVTYYHVELETHDILLAEGLPAESYLDTGNRGTFENASAPMILHPDFAGGQQRRVAGSCLPFIDDTTRIEAIWSRVAVRAGLLGFTLPQGTETTTDPGLHVVIDARAIKPVSSAADRYSFVLPSTDQPARLVSRTAQPCDLRPWVEDRRNLGVMVSRLTLKHGAAVETISLDHPSLTHGWWDVERDRVTLWRWTDGDAVIPLSAAGPALLEITLAGRLDYPLAQQAGAVQASGPASAQAAAA